MKPNVILILMDDLGWMDLSCYGSKFYETPNLDKLAAEGMRFTDAYAACPVCSPSRASILSGKYPARVGVTNYIAHNGSHPARGKLVDAPYIDHLPETEFSLARAMKEGGYATWHVGKWHLGLEPYFPDKHGFDVNVGGCQMGHPWHGYFSPYDIPNLENGPDGEYLPDRLGSEAVNLIKNKNPEQPFFLNFWPYLVHMPLQPKPELEEYFKKKAEKLGLDKIDPFEEGDFFPAEHKKDKRIVRRKLQSDPGYAAMVYSMDENIGRIIEAVRELGELDNTVILFTSDNGGLSSAERSPTCNAPLQEGKGWMYEGGTREPFIAWWPEKIEAGSVCDVPVTSPDFYPTILEIAGLTPRPEQHVDGVSFLPLLTQSGSLEREAIFWHYPHYGNQGGTPGSSLRAGDYKLIEFFEDMRVELYNLRDDIGEEHDLADAMPEKRDELRDMLHAWQKEVEALIPQPNPDFIPWR